MYTQLSGKRGANVLLWHIKVKGTFFKQHLLSTFKYFCGFQPNLSPQQAPLTGIQTSSERQLNKLHLPSAEDAVMQNLKGIKTQGILRATVIHE